MITPESESFFRSGLAKSAFKPSIYQSLPLDYYLHNITDTQKLAFELTSRRIMPKFYQSHDSFLMYYQPYETVYASLKRTNKAAPLWRAIIEKAINDIRFYDFNKVTQHSTELSILAATKFLRSLLKEVDVEEVQKQQAQAQQSQDVPLLTKLTAAKALDEAVTEAVTRAMSEAIKAVNEYAEAKEEAESAIVALAGPGGTGFSKEALSVLRFLQNPDDFRKRVKLLRYAKVFCRKFLTLVPTSLVHQESVSIYGGINGVDRMFSEKQLSDTLPSELVLAQLGDAGKALLALKVAQKQLMVYRRAASIKPILFVDKSGSMVEPFEWRREEPKISVASGLALALHKKLDADVYLFDTEVTKVNPPNVIDVLLKIEADGGTDIDTVLEEIMKIGKKDYLYIIISDGITEASTETWKEFKESGLLERTRVILVPPADMSYRNWLRELDKRGYVLRATDVAQFERAVGKALSSM